MENIMKDIVTRTGGEIYIGVVGAVRSGKSTFINKFIGEKVLPFIQGDIRDKVLDELPQISEGKEIMTVEPKFIPNNSIRISLQDDLEMNVRLVDCVGFIIPDSSGYINNEGKIRMVKTPWFEEEIPFTEAAELGTKKVIKNHSNIGIVVTADGSFGEFERQNYIEAEEKVISELKEYNNPFVIVMNSTTPHSNETMNLCNELSEKYEVSVVPVDVRNMTNDDIDRILKEALYEFDIRELNLNIPSWLSALNDTNNYKQSFNEAISSVTNDFTKFKHIYKIADSLRDNETFTDVSVTSVAAGDGVAEITIKCDDELYDRVLEDILGDSINNRGEFIRLIQDYQEAKREYDVIQTALEEVKLRGYGIAIPRIDDMKLETPEVIKQGSRYGVKVRAIAPSIHMIKVDVESTFEPIIGTESQSKELIEHLMDSDVQNIWDSKIFGRTLSEVVNDGIKAKLYQLPDSTQLHFRNTIERVVNRGKGGIIAIII
ncbi:stage IV sporulation protein A [Mycoplasmatota bacterium WC44]